MPEAILNGDVLHDSIHLDNNVDNEPLSPSLSSPHHSTISEEHDDGGPPLKKRKLAGSSSSPQHLLPRPVSPPWKRFSADGPTSFLKDGRRKSGRTNMVPLELQPQSNKRQTRAAFDKKMEDQQKHSRPSYTLSSKKPSVTPIQLIATKDVATTPEKKRGPGRPPKVRSATTPALETDVPKTETPSVKKEHSTKEQRSVPRSPQQAPRQRSISTTKRPSSSGKETRTRIEGLAKIYKQKYELLSKLEAEANLEESDESSDTSDSQSSRKPSPPLRLQKVTFRVRLPQVAIATPANIPLPKNYGSFHEFLSEDQTEATGPRELLTDQQIHKEAYARWRVRNAQRPGGFLDKKVVPSLPDRQTEPRKQFAHRDHLLAHVSHFRTLLRAERKDHKRKAELLAHEARRYLEQKRMRNKVKTVEEIQQEQIVATRLKMKTTVKDLEKLWLAVQAEVSAQRQKQYEEEQQAEMKGHLARVLDRTDQMLSRGLDMDASALDSDEVADDSSGDETDSSNSEQMSGSDTETETDANVSDIDAEMSLEELKKKYDNVPDLMGITSEAEPDVTANHSTRSGSRALSDEDTDPETEMDSEFDTDDESDDEDAENSDEADEESEDERHGLLSLFSKKEISDMAHTESNDNDENENEPADAAPTILVQADSRKDDDDGVVTSESVGLPRELPPYSDNEPVEGTVTLSDNTHADVDMLVDEPEVPPAIPMNEDVTSASAPDILRVHHTSEDISSEASPRTSETKASEPESASSIDIQNDLARSHSPVDVKSSIKTPVPKLLRGTLREYQHEGLDWLATLYATGRSGILADEMGLGKTIQSIALLAHLAEVHEVWGPHLIVVPTSVMLNWEMEFKKFLPGFKILTYYGNLEERKAKRRGWMADDVFNVCITSYQLVIQDANSFKRRRWQYMILDEAHNIKNFRSERWQTMMTFNTQARLLLTGTPLQNNLTELWSLLFFLHYGQENEGEDDAFAGLKEWSEWFKKPVESILEQGNQVLDEEDKEQVAKLHKVIRPFLLRRLKADVEKQMPLKYEHVEMCRLSKRQRQLYDGFMSRAQTRETLASGNYLSIINALMQLRKVCNHPDLFETRPINTSFAMQKSAITDFEINDLIVRRKMLTEPFDKIDLDFLQLAPISRENMSMMEFIETSRRHAYHQLKNLRDSQWRRTDRNSIWLGNGTTNILQSLEDVARNTRLQELDRTLYFEAYRHHQHPVYGGALLTTLRFGTTYHQLSQMPNNIILPRNWEIDSPFRSLDMVQSVATRSQLLQPYVERFACLTPAVVANGLNNVMVTENTQTMIRTHRAGDEYDPFHTARMKLSIAFPDKRLLQYDCGKLQRLDKLLRRLQAGGHRALIFTQMTKVLDILEQFLNIHGHRYLRLDGATKIEQRQILTDRFNNDTRILAFILSSRSGGLGINLTGADTVIFYDLDWNPAMDKQCTDRAHRIGQTRDVHIYRFVSEHTIESNILRKASQKQLLDDVVIQEGDFTTDYMNRLSYRDMLEDNTEDDMAGAAMDRVLGNDKGTVAAFEQAEDKEDSAAAKVAAKEVQHVDDGDFDDRNINHTPHNDAATPAGPYDATNAALADVDKIGEDNHHIDNYMIRLQKYLVQDVPLSVHNKSGKRGKKKKHDEHRIKRHR